LVDILIIISHDGSFTSPADRIALELTRPSPKAMAGGDQPLSLIEHLTLTEVLQERGDLILTFQYYLRKVPLSLLDAEFWKNTLSKREGSGVSYQEGSFTSPTSK
jgi:hypothetical protein